MAYGWLIQLITALAFMLEVVNPSSTFVREQPASGFAKSFVKASFCSGPEVLAADAKVDAPDSGDGDEFLVASAILPTLAAHSSPALTCERLFTLDLETTRGFVVTIHRPPSLS